MKNIISYFKHLSEHEALKFLLIFYLVGFVGFLLPVSRPIFELLIPVSLLTNVFLLFLFHRPYNWKHLRFFIAIVLLTFIIEAIGVNTGVLFGEYYYGKSLPVKIWGTPVIIGFNWLLLSYGVVVLLRMKPVLRKYLPILAGVLMTLFDSIMEPVAMKTGMWNWTANSVPLQNYVIWFMVSVLIAASFEIFEIKTQQKIGAWIFVLQFFFFVLLNLFLS